MNKAFPLQFNLSIGGIISSIIWILAKFGLFQLSIYEWISVSLLIFSLAMFLYFLIEMNDKYLLLSISLFLVSIVFLVYFFESSGLNNRFNFSFDFFYYALAFSLITFFIIKSFFSDHKINLFVSFVLLFFTLILIWLFQNYSFSIKSSRAFLISSKSKEILSYLTNICLILLISFPIKDIISEIKNTKRE